MLEGREGQAGIADPDVVKAKKNESTFLLSSLPSQAFVIALDQGGKTLASEDLARIMREQGESGRPIIYIIGGSWGLDKEVLDRADLIVSFGRITLPHSLARVVLAEQIYRGNMIIEGRKYHK